MPLPLWLLLLLSLALRSSSAAAAEPATRPAWTTSRVVGSPDPPPPYQVVRAFSTLKFDRPCLLVRGPEGNRMFVGLQSGVLFSFEAKPEAQAELCFDLRKEIATVGLLPNAKGVDAVYGLAFHPEFAKNRQCFLCYTLRGDGRLLGRCA